MFKKFIAMALIVGQIFMPLSAQAGLLENLISDTVSKVVTSARDGFGSTTSSGQLSHRSDGILVFSDGDPMVFDPTDEVSSKRTTEHYLEIKNRIASKSVLDMQDLVHFGNAIRPYINYLENVERIRSGESLTLPPGTSVQIETGAFCIDPGIPAPAHGSDLMLVKNTNILPPKALPVYEGLMKYSIRNPDERQNIQVLLHDLRNLQTAPPYLVGGIGSNKKAYMDKVMPNGGKLLEEYTRSSIEKARLGQPRELQTLEEAQQYWNKQATIGDGVSATIKDVGGNAVGTLMTVTNNSNRSFTFNPADYSAAPATVGKQRLGISGATNIIGSDGRPLINEKQVKLVESLVLDAQELLGSKSVSFGTTSVAAITVKNPVVQKLFKAAPVASTMIAAWELYSGRDFFSGKELSNAEKVLAAMSLVPAAGTVTRILGESTKAVIKVAAAAGRNVKTYGGAMTKETVDFYSNEIYHQPVPLERSQELAREALVAYSNDASTPLEIRKTISKKL